ncbi:MAG: hypothetical protein ACRD0O_13450, partial [Acidimicrobiia bacterium]
MTGLLVAALSMWLALGVAPVVARGGVGPGGDAMVDQLRIAPEGPRTGYRPGLFTHWVDEDGDGCDTREEVLMAESTVPPETDPARCTVLTG